MVYHIQNRERPRPDRATTVSSYKIPAVRSVPPSPGGSTRSGTLIGWFPRSWQIASHLARPSKPVYSVFLSCVVVCQWTSYLRDTPKHDHDAISVGLAAVDYQCRKVSGFTGGNVGCLVCRSKNITMAPVLNIASSFVIRSLCQAKVTHPILFNSCKVRILNVLDDLLLLLHQSNRLLCLWVIG